MEANGSGSAFVWMRPFKRGIAHVQKPCYLD